MKVVTAWYGNIYRKFMRVLGKSVEANCPGVSFVAEQMRSYGQRAYAHKHVTDNSAKLEVWNRCIQEADEEVVLLDADMLVLRDVAEAFAGEEEWDIANTVRPGPLLYQGGAVYVRPTDAAKEFMQAWTEQNRRILDDVTGLQNWTETYGGINQAALACTIDGWEGDALLGQLPCSIWNSCAQTWETFSPDTAVVHLTGPLRKQCCACRMPPDAPQWTQQRQTIIAAWLYYAQRI